MNKYTTTQKNYISEGCNQDMQLREHIRSTLGIDQSVVESKRHTIISGPPGVGKTFSIMQEIAAANVNYIKFSAGATESSMAMQLAHNVNILLPGEELVVLLDDADDVLFGDYQTANKFKFAMAEDEPVFAQDVNMVSARAQYLKAGRQELVNAIDAFTIPGKVGIVIPTDQVRFVVVCNRNCEARKEFNNKIWSAAQALVDRVKYKRLDFEWKVSWGWLAYILNNSQPFENVSLTDEQKYEITNWMWVNWEKMRNQSYRTVKEMAEYLIKYDTGKSQTHYLDMWDTTFIEKG